jgi:(E)-4-hydroxy-3-methylbut-2-enyl-diphosphate synthase
MLTLDAPAQASHPNIPMTFPRRRTRPVPVGDVTIGGDHPVVVQSMINEDTLDVAGSVRAIQRLHQMGCEIVRVTVPSLAHAHAVAEIRQQLQKQYKDVPLVADVHHNGMKIALEVANTSTRCGSIRGCMCLKNPRKTARNIPRRSLMKLRKKSGKLWHLW